MIEKLQFKGNERGGIWAGIPVCLGFLLLAAWFLLGPDLATIPDSKASIIPLEYLSTEPRRIMLADPPVITIDGFERTCMDCHKMFPPREVAPGWLLQHRHVVLNHGINDQCRNCHDSIDRDRLVLQSGESIPYARVVELCAKCHGPIYRDWERGMHGRTQGYWDKDKGEQHRLSCTECHNPHTPRVPAMEPVRPLPPPNTLRMSKPAEGHQGTPEKDPLRQAMKSAGQKPSHIDQKPSHEGGE
jgi:hypothetical protein